MNEQQEIWNGLAEDWSISAPQILSREEILKQLELRISELLQQQPEIFFQLMYRLDIPEDRLVAALQTGETAVADLAEMIYERQLQKLRSRAEFRRDSSEGDKELDW